MLDVVLSTDGVEPQYFLTDQDVLYQARCKDIIAGPTPVGVTVEFQPDAHVSTRYVAS